MGKGFQPKRRSGQETSQLKTGAEVQPNPQKKIAALAVDRLIDRAGRGRDDTRTERVRRAADDISVGFSSLKAMANPRGKQDIRLKDFLELLCMHAPESYARIRECLAEISAGGPP